MALTMHPYSFVGIVHTTRSCLDLPSRYHTDPSRHPPHHNDTWAEHVVPGITVSTYNQAFRVPGTGCINPLFESFMKLPECSHALLEGPSGACPGRHVTNRTKRVIRSVVRALYNSLHRNGVLEQFVTIFKGWALLERVSLDFLCVPGRPTQADETGVLEPILHDTHSQTTCATHIK